MFQTAPGCEIPFPEAIREEFSVYSNYIRANISFEYLAPILQEFLELLPEPLFFVLHLPLMQQEERRLGFRGPYSHDEVLYLDGQSIQQVREILKSFGQLLLCDGMSQFAVASHRSKEEIFIQKYKLTDIYAPQPREFVPLLEKYGLHETGNLVTVWDTFTPQHPGCCRAIELEGLSSYKVAEMLKKKGMHRVDIVEG